MRADELAAELVEFWFAALAVAGWERRLQILKGIRAQMLANVEIRAESDAVSPRFIAAIIERLDAPPVESAAQAQIYSSSSEARHQEAARAWSYRSDRMAAKLADGFVREERRRFPREYVDALSEIWVRGRAAPCLLLDLSDGGARVVVREPAPSPGTTVRLAVPDAGVRDATVVFRNSGGIGVQFRDQPTAA